MKKVVIIFIVSTMVLTGMSESASKDKEKECTGVSQPHEEEQTEETVASVEAVDNRFYAKYSEAISKLFGEPESESENEAASDTDSETKQSIEDADSEQQTENVTEQIQEETEAETETQTEPQPQESVVAEPQTQVSEELQTEVCETEPENIVQAEPVCSSVSDIGIYISDSDYSELLKIVEAEAGNQDDVGKILVANVIFNRVRNGEFPSTVTDVIYQNGNGTYQFEPVLNGRINTVSVSDSTVECVNRAISGEDYSQGALYFTMRTSDDSWFNRCLTLLFIHGDHYFYTC